MAGTMNASYGAERLITAAAMADTQVRSRARGANPCPPPAAPHEAAGRDAEHLPHALDLGILNLMGRIGPLRRAVMREGVAASAASDARRGRV